MGRTAHRRRPPRIDRPPRLTPSHLVAGGRTPKDLLRTSTPQDSTMATLQAIAGKKYKLDSSENFDEFMKAIGNNNKSAND